MLPPDHVGKLPLLKPAIMALPNLAARLVGGCVRSSHIELVAYVVSSARWYCRWFVPSKHL